jgi:putative endonuclease
MKKVKKSSYNFGILAEELAALYLRLKFYNILQRRYKTNMGEVDIIAKRGKSIVFIEVKARKNGRDIHEVITTNQKNRITRAAEVYLFHNKKLANDNIRFDVILLAPQFLIKHIKNAW